MAACTARNGRICGKHAAMESYPGPTGICDFRRNHRVRRSVPPTSWARLPARPNPEHTARQSCDHCACRRAREKSHAGANRVKLTIVDWTVVAAYFLLNLLIGLYYKKRAGQNTSEYFLSGREAPWWLAGTSMVATTFAADTPLAVTGMVARNGIAGNWLWWNSVASGMLTVFFFARLWRRSAVMTDVEFAEIRYAGRPAAFLRGFLAVYLGILMNCIILGWVNLAMVKILSLILGVNKD